MIEFVRILEEGIHLDAKLAPAFQKYLELLAHLNVLKIKKNKYYLLDKFRIGKEELKKAGYGFVRAFDNTGKDWIGEKNLLKGAQKGAIG